MDKDPAKELPFNGVYRYAGGKLERRDQGLDVAQRPSLLAGRQNTVRRQLRPVAIRDVLTTLEPNGSISNGRMLIEYDAKETGRAVRTASRSTAPATSGRPVQAACASSRREAKCWARSCCRRSLRISALPRRAGTRTSPLRPASIDSRLRRAGMMPLYQRDWGNSDEITLPNPGKALPV